MLSNVIQAFDGVTEPLRSQLEDYTARLNLALKGAPDYDSGWKPGPVFTAHHRLHTYNIRVEVHFRDSVGKVSCVPGQYSWDALNIDTIVVNANAAEIRIMIWRWE